MTGAETKRTRWTAWAICAVAVVAGTQTALAQPADLPLAPATTTAYPPGVTVAKTPSGPVYVDAGGRTLYGLDLRTLVRWGNPAFYCRDRCAEWQPLLAPPAATINIAYPQGFGERLRKAIEAGIPFRGASGEARTDGFYSDPLKAPDWTVIAGPAGPQWVYKGWHMVYVRRGDGRASTSHDGAENLTWNTLKFVPPAPRVEAPAGVRPVLAGEEYVLADRDGRALFTGTCAAPCYGWKPLAAGMASTGIGAWKVSNRGERAQWTWLGKPVYVSQESDPARVPPTGQVLRP